MIDLETERLLSPAEACRHPAYRGPGGRPSHLSKIYRDFQRGKVGPDGERVRLESVKSPRGLKTSHEAIARFVAALTGTPIEGDAAPTRPTRSKRAALAAAENAFAGW